MSIIVDAIIIGLIALCTFIGYKQGLIKVAVKICSFIIAIVVALAIYKPVANIIIEKTPIDEKMQSMFVGKIVSNGLEVNSELPITSNVSNSLLKGVNNTVTEIGTTLSIKIIEIGTLLIVFIIVKILLKCISALADLIAKIPILKQFNEAGGAIYGLLKGIIIVYTVLALISFAGIGIPMVLEKINSSMLGKWMYNNNILLEIIF